MDLSNKNNRIIFFFITWFGGMFGIHWFIQRNYMKGCLYLLTCGGFIFCWFYDWIIALINIFSYKQERFQNQENPLVDKTKITTHLHKHEKNIDKDSNQEERKNFIMGLFNKKELQRIQELEQQNSMLLEQLDRIGAKNYAEVQEMIINSKKEYDNVNENLKKLKEQLKEVEGNLKSKQLEIDKANIDIDMMDFGIYKPKYNCMNSDEYAQKIQDIRDQQKALIKNKKALSFSDAWTLDGSKAKGRAMNNDNMKMYLRAFNNECDVLISKVKFNNFDKIKDRIEKCANALDKLNQRNKIAVTYQYKQLKIDELHLVHEYNVKKQEEKEAMRAAREDEREQAKLQKEIQEARKKITKEQKHYENAKEKLLQQLTNANDLEINEIKDKIKEIDTKLAEISKSIEEIDYREANQRAGYVYVISNIGAFGENVYKIGMTRRLEPQDRVEELGDASVPFKFDIHAMIFSDDAPKLENALHKAFEDKKVNMINGRKEFFKVSLDEIEKVVKENHDKLVEFNKTADAEQYRESLKIREKMKEIPKY